VQALTWHPDRHRDANAKEAANEKFIEVGDLYPGLDISLIK
jgi:curved DNA-binding protein CbpA